MSGKDRARQAVREVGFGVGTVGLALVLTLWGSLAAIQTVFLVMTLGVLLWTATTRLDRLRGPAGWPRPLLFGGLAILAAVNASVFSFTGLATFLLTTGVLATALMVGLTRVLRRVGA
jgi:hypothetical protein